MVLINMIDLKELVSVTLRGTKYKEAETNAKIVDLVNHSIDTCVQDTFGSVSLGRFLVT